MHKKKLFITILTLLFLSFSPITTNNQTDFPVVYNPLEYKPKTNQLL